MADISNDEWSAMVNNLRDNMSNETSVGIGSIGNVDSGKSTLISNLSNRILDDGDGRSRSAVLIHAHEKARGQTSDVAHNILSFSKKQIADIANCVSVNEGNVRKNDDQDSKRECKTISFYDLCGHEKYFGTTASSMSVLDYVMLVIEPHKGIQKMTKEHLKIAMSINIPVMIVITKIDVAVPNDIAMVMKQISNTLKLYKRKSEYINTYDDFLSYTRGEERFIQLCTKHSTVPYYTDESKLKHNVMLTTQRNDSHEFMIELQNVMKSTSYDEFNAQYGTEYDEAIFNDLSSYVMYPFNTIERIKKNVKYFTSTTDLMNLNKDTVKQSIVPITFVSNVTGYHLDVVRNTLAFVTPRDIWSTESNTIVKAMKRKLNIGDINNDLNEDETVFYIKKTYNVKGVGLVLYGICRGEPLSVNQVCYIGPFNKIMHKVKIKSIQNDNELNVNTLEHHSRGCISINFVDTKLKLKQGAIKSGMVVVSHEHMRHMMSYRFQAAIAVLSHDIDSVTMREGSTAILHIGSDKQTGRIVGIDTKNDPFCDKKHPKFLLGANSIKKMEKQIIETNTIKYVTIKLIYNPSFLQKNQVFFIRSSTIHAVGLITDVLPLDEDPYAITEKKHTKRKLIDMAEQLAGRCIENPGKSKARPSVVIPKRTVNDANDIDTNDTAIDTLDSCRSMVTPTSRLSIDSGDFNVIKM